MKYLSLFLTIVIFACTKTDTLTPTDSVSVPDLVSNIVKTEFPDATDGKYEEIEKQKLWEYRFKWKAKDMGLVINNSGIISEYSKFLTNAELPAAAKEFIDKNYPGSTVKSVIENLDKNKASDGHKILILTKEGSYITLVFDAKGTLVLLMVLPKDAKEVNTSKDNSNKAVMVSESDLPAAIKTAIKTKLGDYKFVKALLLKQDTKKTYTVVVTKDLTVYELVYNEDGALIKESSSGQKDSSSQIAEIAEKDLPADIKSLLTKEFAGYLYQKGTVYKKDGQIAYYQIIIKQNGKVLNLKFDDKFKLIAKSELGTVIADAATTKVGDEKDLTKEIVTYLATKHKEYKVLKVLIKTQGEGKTFTILISADNMLYEYVMDDKAKTVKVNSTGINDSMISIKEIIVTDLPAKAKEYLDKKYSGYVYQKGTKSIVAEKLVSYQVIIKLGTDLYFLTFDGEGSFLAARKG